MIIKNKNDLIKLKEFINDNEFLAFDIETDSLDTRGGNIIGFGVSNATSGFYVCHLEYDAESGNLDERINHADCRAILEVIKTKKLIMWNGSFDTRFTYNYFDVNLIDSLWSEGMLAKHTADEERPFGLKDVAKRLFGSDAAEEQRIMKESIKKNGGGVHDYYKADLDVMAEYCIADCKLTYAINDHYLNMLKKEGLSDFFFKEEVMPLYKLVTIPMELKGVPVDVKLIEESKDKITKDINLLEYRIQSAIAPLLYEFELWYLNKELPPRRSGEFAQYVCKYASLDLPLTKSGKFSVSAKNIEGLKESKFKEFLLGGDYLDEETVERIQRLWWQDQEQDYMFNLSSKHHLKKLFFEKLGETPLTKTPTGQPQVNDFFLEDMAKKYKWCELLQQYNKLNKLRSTYMDRILEKQEDGIYYPSFQQHRTISGRFGSDLQQLPRPKEKGELPDLVLKYNNMIRKFFIAGKGYKFIDSDYESLEPHVFAHVSGDQGLKDIFIKGHDFYSTIAIQTEKLEGVSADKKAENFLGKINKPLRQKAKAYSLGVPYGLGGYALGKQLDISTEEGDALVEAYLDGFPQLKGWMDKSFEQCVSKGFVKSEAGRIRHMHKAPKIWYGHSDYILDSLQLWKKYHDCPKKYSSMKHLRKELKNYINNSRNFQIQSLAASITNRACIAISRELLRQGINGYVCAQIHDQIVVRVPERDAEKWQKTVQYLMENTYKISLPLKAPAELGDDFYEAH